MTKRIIAKAEWKAADGAPDIAFVPPMERRRLTALEKAALGVAAKVYPKGRQIPVVFASRWGEIGVTLKLMQQMHAEGEMSPAGFSNSVHNAMPGHLSRFFGNKAKYTAIAAGPESYAMGLMEAEGYEGEVVFIYAEESTPEMYRPHFGDPVDAHAVAMLLGDAEGTDA